VLYSAVLPNHDCRCQVRPLTRLPVLFLKPNTSLNYTWINQERKSVNLPAPTYIDYVMTWVQNLLDDESVFPTKSGMLFSRLLSSSQQLFPQVMTFRNHSPQLSNMFIASFSASLHTYITRTIHSFYTCARSPTLTHFLLTSWHLGESTSYWISRMSKEL